MSVGHHSIDNKVKRTYIFSMSPSVLKESVKYTDYGNEQSSIESKEETIHLSRCSLLNRQSKRDRRCLRKLEVLSQSVWRTSFNNNVKWKNVYTFGKSKCLQKCAVKYTDYGNEQSSIESKEDTIHLSRYPLINRQSKRDRRCLRKFEELSWYVSRTSFNNNNVKEGIYFRWVQVS